MLRNATAITVLVVEDEPILRMDTVDLLEQAGFAAIEAGNAEDALHLLAERDDIGLLFTDVQMPGQPDGFGLARQVRSTWPGIAIVVCSAYQVPKAGELPAGVAFIPKPFSAQMALKVIKLLNLPRAHLT